MSNKALTVYETLKQHEQSVAGWIPREMAKDSRDRERILGEVLRHAQLQCAEHFPGEVTPRTARSIYLAVVTFVQARIVPNKALGLGYFIPYSGVVTPIFGYRGLLQCAYRESGARVAYGQVVVKGDSWDRSMPWHDRWLSWEPGPDHRPEAPIESYVAAFSRFRWADGFDDVFTMGGEELRTRAERAKGGKRSSPWGDWSLQMAAKTVLRRHITSGRILWSGDGFLPQADALAEAGQMRDLACALAARDADVPDAARQQLVELAEQVEADHVDTSGQADLLSQQADDDMDSLRAAIKDAETLQELQACLKDINAASVRHKGGPAVDELMKQYKARHVELKGK